MNRPRFTTVTLCCVLLAIPASALTACLCSTDIAAQACACSTASTGGGCCSSPATDISCCTSETPDCLGSSCGCSVQSSNDAVLATHTKDRGDFTIAMLAFDAADRPPTVSISILSHSDRSPIGNHPLQTELCVWRE